MIDELMPSNVVSIETDRDLIEIDLFPEEQESLGNAVEKRRREFVTGRACARLALGRLGISPCAIANGERGEPLWPEGVVGSITHCRGYRACAVAMAEDVGSLGIDAELHERLPPGVLEQIATRREREWLASQSPEAHMDRLLFSAKEAVYKAWFPLTRRWLGFEDAELFVDVNDATFRARLLVPGAVLDGERLTEFRGRWRVDGNLVLTTVVVPR